MLALALPCLATVLAAVGLAWWHGERLRAEATRGTLLEKKMVPALERWAATKPPPGRTRGLFFGDSLTMAPARSGETEGDPPRWPKSPFGYALPVIVSRSLASSGAPVEMVNWTHVALRPVHLAYVLDELLASRPRFAVIEINLRLLSPEWRPVPAHSFHPLSRKLPLSREVELGPALRSEGLGLLQPTVFRVQEAVSLLYAIEGARLLASSVLARSARQVEGMLGLQRRFLPMTTAEGEEVEISAYPADPSRHVTAGVLRGIRERLASAGVEVLFYVSPLNPETVPPGAVAQVAGGIESLRKAVGATPEEWLDLHDGLPTSAFRDRKNHLTIDGLHWVAARLAERIRPLASGGGAPQPPHAKEEVRSSSPHGGEPYGVFQTPSSGTIRATAAASIQPELPLAVRTSTKP